MHDRAPLILVFHSIFKYYYAYKNNGTLKPYEISFYTIFHKLKVLFGRLHNTSFHFDVFMQVIDFYFKLLTEVYSQKKQRIYLCILSYTRKRRIQQGSKVDKESKHIPIHGVSLYVTNTNNCATGRSLPRKLNFDSHSSWCSLGSYSLFIIYNDTNTLLFSSFLTFEEDKESKRPAKQWRAKVQ